MHLSVNRARFLVLPQGRELKNLAWRVLGLNLRRLRVDWRERWGHSVELAETFIDPKRYRGTVYRAANWIKLVARAGSAPTELAPYPEASCVTDRGNCRTGRAANRSGPQGNQETYAR